MEVTIDFDNHDEDVEVTIDDDYEANEGVEVTIDSDSDNDEDIEVTVDADDKGFDDISKLIENSFGNRSPEPQK